LSLRRPNQFGRRFHIHFNTGRLLAGQIPGRTLRPRPVKKNIVFSAILLALCLVLGLGFGEAILRVKNLSMQNYDIEMWRYAGELKHRSDDPVLGHEHNVSSEAVLQSVKIRINDHGLRGPPLRQPAPPRRVLFLGASITLGWGVDEDKTMTSLIQKKFDDAGQNVEVLNAGIGNYNAERYTELFFTKLKDLKPTDIVVHYFLRDAEKLDAGGGNAVLRNSELAVTVWIAMQRMFGENGPTALEDHYKKVYDPQEPGYIAMRASLQKLTDYAKVNNIKLTIAMVPDVHDLKNYRFGWIHQHMADVAKQLGVPFIDLLPAFQGLKPEDVWAMPGDPHPNALGHKLMADAIYPALIAP
jgi:lysophospholipase L1-like esterase